MIGSSQQGGHFIVFLGNYTWGWGRCSPGTCQQCLLNSSVISLSFSLSLSSSSLHPLLFSCSAALNLSIPLRDLPLLYWLNARRQNTPAGPPAQPSGCNSWLPSLWSRGRLIRGTSVDKTRTSHASATGQSRPPSTQTVILGLNSFKPVFKGDQ